MYNFRNQFDTFRQTNNQQTTAQPQYTPPQPQYTPPPQAKFVPPVQHITSANPNTSSDSIAPPPGPYKGTDGNMYFPSSAPQES